MASSDHICSGDGDCRGQLGLSSPALAETGVGHHLYPSASTPQWYYLPAPFTYPDRPDSPHTDGPDMTFYTPWYGGGTAVTNLLGNPGKPMSWNGWEWCGS